MGEDEGKQMLNKLKQKRKEEYRVDSVQNKTTTKKGGGGGGEKKEKDAKGK